jgi:hypothetical protein
LTRAQSCRRAIVVSCSPDITDIRGTADCGSASQAGPVGILLATSHGFGNHKPDKSGANTGVIDGMSHLSGVLASVSSPNYSISSDSIGQPGVELSVGGSGRAGSRGSEAPATGSRTYGRSRSTGSRG